MDDKNINTPDDKGNIYDKIFKENAEQIFLPLIEERLGIKIESFRPLKEKMQTTVEREMDFYYEIVTDTGDEFNLNIEFQLHGSMDMVYRLGEYQGMALRRVKKRIEHVVIYLGKGKSTMSTELTEDQIYKGFHLINISQLNTKNLLTSQVPEMVILAILGNDTGEQSERILRSIVKRLQSLAPEPNKLSRYMRQLMIFLRLRKFDDKILQILLDMPITYNIEQDILYKQGIQEGKKEGIVEGLEKGLEKTVVLGWKNDFDVKTLQLITGLSGKKVKDIISGHFPDVRF